MRHGLSTEPATRFAGPPRQHRRALAAALLALCAMASAHDFKLGPLVIDHPYATPTPAGARNGAVYFRTLRNTGDDADRLVAARTPAAGAVEIHRSTGDGDATSTRVIPTLELPARSEFKLRHDGDTHLKLVDLKEPLRDGQRFALWLRFERAGEREVTVWVQTPKDRDPHRH